jgi:hypothetical protein
MALEKTLFNQLTAAGCGVNDFMIVLKPNDPNFYKVKIANIKTQLQAEVQNNPGWEFNWLNNSYNNETLFDFRNNAPWYSNNQETVPANTIYTYMFQSYDMTNSQGRIVIDGKEVFKTTGSQDDTNSGLFPVLVAGGKTIQWEGMTVVRRRRFL